MKTTLTALTLLLFAGAATAALAQEREQDRGDRPQVHQGGPRGNAGGGPQRQIAPQGAPPPAATPAAPASPATPAAPPTGRGWEGRGRFGAPPAPGAAPGPGAAPPVDRGGQHFQGGGPADGRRFDRGGPGGERRFQPDGRPGEVTPPAGRSWDRTGAPPREVVPPQAGDQRSWDRDRGGRPGVNPDWRRDGRDDRHDRDGRHERWERGRYPPIYWSQQRYRLGAYRAPYGYYSRAWGFGDFLPRGWYAEDYWLNDFFDYGLPYPPPGFEWVRVGGDALLVDRYSGRIVQVVRGIFW